LTIVPAWRGAAIRAGLSGCGDGSSMWGPVLRLAHAPKAPCSLASRGRADLRTRGRLYRWLMQEGDAAARPLVGDTVSL